MNYSLRKASIIAVTNPGNVPSLFVAQISPM